VQMAKAKVRTAMDAVGDAYRTGYPSFKLDASGKGLGACCAGWDFVARQTMLAGNALSERRFISVNFELS
jgi:hypothetical protein